MDTQMTLRPRVSEKAYELSQSRNVYIFEVPLSANKLTVARAVEAQFKVSVMNVNIAVAKGKVKQSYRKRMRPVAGRRNNVKKAYVTLKKDNHIPIFAVEEAEEKAAKKKEKKS
jgi:large subunit ribosomal protein L23